MDTVLVTGGSMGLGLETAIYLAGKGFRVYATILDEDHRPDVLEAAERRGVVVQLLQMDVTDRPSIDAAVEAVVAETGGIFGLVNNAGIGLRGCFEDLTEDEVRRVFEVNVFGTMAVTRRVLPHLRAAGRGRIVTITSVGGRIATFGLSAYCSTKFALEGFGEALALEAALFGVQAVLIEPGIVMTTRWTINRGFAAHALDPGSPYATMFRRHEALADHIAQTTRNRPVDVAKAVHRALTTRHPRMHYSVGWPSSGLVAARGLLPGGLFERLYFRGLLNRLTRDEPSRPPAVSGEVSRCKGSSPGPDRHSAPRGAGVTLGDGVLRGQ